MSLPSVNILTVGRLEICNARQLRISYLILDQDIASGGWISGQSKMECLTMFFVANDLSCSLLSWLFSPLFWQLHKYKEVDTKFWF